MKTLKINLWQIRNSQNLNLYDVEHLTGISKSTINNFENGRTVPRLDQLEVLAKKLGVRMTDLFDSPYK